MLQYDGIKYDSWGGYGLGHLKYLCFVLSGGKREFNVKLVRVSNITHGVYDKVVLIIIWVTPMKKRVLGKKTAMGHRLQAIGIGVAVDKAFSPSRA